MAIGGRIGVHSVHGYCRLQVRRHNGGLRVAAGVSRASGALVPLISSHAAGKEAFLRFDLREIAALVPKAIDLVGRKLTSLAASDQDEVVCRSYRLFSGLKNVVLAISKEVKVSSPLSKKELASHHLVHDICS